MTIPKPFIGQQPFKAPQGHVSGELVNFQGEQMYRVGNFDLIPPFLMSITSSSDLWMFLSSSGSLTAGRQNYNHSLFPYETDDKLHQSAHVTGPVTIIRLLSQNEASYWEPFSSKYQGLYLLNRNLYKNISGNKVVFEEINHDLNLTFRYAWMSSDELGWVRCSELVNNSKHAIGLEILDGLLNIQPCGVTRELQSMMSTLVDAYKSSELHGDFNMALYYLSSIPVDRAEPSEALRANVVWANGLIIDNMLLSPKQLNSFRQGMPLETENKIDGQKNAFIVKASLEMGGGDAKSWHVIADVAMDGPGVVNLQASIANQPRVQDYIARATANCTRRIAQLVALSDGIQHTGDALNDARHFANVLFNIMRGGIFEQEYLISKEDFIEHLRESNPVVYHQHEHMLESLEQTIHLHQLLNVCQCNLDLFRLAQEYLPLGFSRRHGDPSRPWNFFDIRIKKEDGTPWLNYQGNWRDIFQNWEALGFSFPAFVPGMVSRFLNASTADGYNPYRITREGFDWEVPEPDNPWAFIGYWGDHQLVYLLRLMELQEKFYPGQLMQNAGSNVHVYARVPYRIKKYSEIIKNPRETIIFDKELHENLLNNSTLLGNDGKLLYSPSGEVQRATFIEKILVTLLTKLGNYVPGAGIWLNTQRPEWNDANNALVGYGVSVVTLCYLRRFISFFSRLLGQTTCQSFTISAEVSDFYENIAKTFTTAGSIHGDRITPFHRLEMVNALGIAGEIYREKVYEGFSGTFVEINRVQLLDFLGTVLRHIERSIMVNRRYDGLFHSYNLIEISDEGIFINNLELMLEGQVAILSSELLDPACTVQLLESLFSSALWRPDQSSFMLYPWKDLPSFLQKNRVPNELVKQSKWLNSQVKTGKTSILKQDLHGNSYFNPDLRNGAVLRDRLQKLAHDGDELLTPVEMQIVEGIYEEVFRHKFFTGRSGSFYKYEGIGSIYWHMVSKLLLAVGESINMAFGEDPLNPVLSELFNYYFRVRDGLGVHKNPSCYGAFPTDPYSHTPLMMGAQQPGLTGQVKEDVLSRFAEMGIVVENGKIRLQKCWLTGSLFNEAGKAVFSLFNTGFVIETPNPTSIRVEYNEPGKDDLILNSLELPADVSKSLFHRDKTLKRVLFY